MNRARYIRVDLPKLQESSNRIDVNFSGVFTMMVGRHHPVLKTFD